MASIRLSRPELLRSSESRVGYRIVNGEAERLAEMASFDHGRGRDFAAGVGEGGHDLADGAAGATFNPRDGQDDGGGPAADGQGAEAALVGRHLPAGVLDPVELPDPGQHRHPAQDLGRFLSIEPLRPDDPVHPTRILFVYKATSPYNRRVEQRRALKRRLGRQYRSQVTKASRSNKKDFLKFDLTPDGAHAIRSRLKMDPGRF
jgi:hypothetical protein